MSSLILHGDRLLASLATEQVIYLLTQDYHLNYFGFDLRYLRSQCYPANISPLFSAEKASRAATVLYSLYYNLNNGADFYLLKGCTAAIDQKPQRPLGLFLAG